MLVRLTVETFVWKKFAPILLLPTVGPEFLGDSKGRGRKCGPGSGTGAKRFW